MNCGNCSRALQEGDDAYAIERGSIEMNDYSGTLWFAGRGNLPGPDLVLCADCYDDNWLIGKPLLKNQHLIDG